MKKANAFGTAAIHLIYFFFICLISGQSVRADSAIQFKLVQNHWIVVPVLVNGQGPFDFLLDTGANVTIITPELAQRVAIRPTARVSLITIAGSQVVPYSHLPSLSLGPRTAENLEVIHSSLPEMRSLCSSISGVLGQNFLSQFNYSLNYQNRRIEFEQARPEDHPAAERLPVEQLDGRLLITARPSSSKKKAFKLVLDSGVSMLIIFETTSKPLKLDLKQGEDRFLTASTTLGSRTLPVAKLPTLQLGRIKLSDLPVALVDGIPGENGGFGHGLLATSFFSSIFFNNREGYVILSGRTTR